MLLQAAVSEVEEVGARPQTSLVDTVAALQKAAVFAAVCGASDSAQVGGGGGEAGRDGEEGRKGERLGRREEENGGWKGEERGKRNLRDDRGGEGNRQVG